MITEDYVSFETAKLLKEKGFNSYVTSFYEEDGNPCVELYASKELDWNSKTEFYSRPTLQMAMKWLRETHNFFIGINTVIGSDNIWAQILNTWGYEAFIQKQEVPIPSKLQWDWFPTYEQACEAAIKYCLEKLI